MNGILNQSSPGKQCCGVTSGLAVSWLSLALRRRRADGADRAEWRADLPRRTRADRAPPHRGPRRWAAQRARPRAAPSLSYTSAAVAIHDQPAAIGAFTRPLCHASLRRNNQKELDLFGGINKYRELPVRPSALR